MITRTAQAVGVGVMAALTANLGERLDENTHIKLGSALAVAGVVIPAVWWLSSWLRGIRDSIDTLERQLRELPCNVDACSERAPSRTTAKPSTRH